jgi:hypothetical protein
LAAVFALELAVRNGRFAAGGGGLAMEVEGGGKDQEAAAQVRAVGRTQGHVRKGSICDFCGAPVFRAGF